MKLSQALAITTTLLTLSVGTFSISGWNQPSPVTILAGDPQLLPLAATHTPVGNPSILATQVSFFSSAASVVVTDYGMYVVEKYEGGASVWFHNDGSDQTRLGGVRTLKGLANGGDGQILYAWDDSGSIYELPAGESAWQDMKPRPPLGELDALAVSMDGQIIYAQSGEQIWIHKEGETTWIPLNLEDAFPSEYDPQFNTLTIGPKGVYVLAYCGNQIGIGRGDSVCGSDVLLWNEEDGTSALIADAGIGSIERIVVSGDGLDVLVITSAGVVWTSVDGEQWSIDSTLLEYGVSTFLFEPQSRDSLYLGTEQGLFRITDKGLDREPVGGIGPSNAVNDIAYHPYLKVLLVAADNGIDLIPLAAPPTAATPSATPPPTGTPAPTTAVIPTSTATPVTVWGTTQQWFEENNKKPWFWPITVLGGFLSTYTVGVSALLLWAWRGGSTIFSRTWLHTIAAKPLLITPGLGRWALFIGYGQRLLKLKSVEKASKDYFGLPAADPNGSPILPDAKGDSLHERIAQALGPQQPIMLLGKGGAGKSTLLARWVYLGLTSQLPASLRGFRPVLVPASYYEKSLLKAIADTLRERDGIAVDESVVQAQLQSGKYLILFDGISEVDSDKLQAINDIIRTARNADFQNCRFLISTRPLEGIPADISTFQLQPLTVNVILDLLPRYDLERERENLLRRQLQSFGDRPVEPLLFTMALDQSGSGQLSTTRSQLYERYFRRLLRAESDETSWAGWRAALEKLAEWFLLDTGRRGVGLPYEPLVDLIAGKKSAGTAEGSLLERLKRFYRLPAKDELDLLQYLQASGLLHGGRRWRFAHDTFEEYFAASCLVSRLDKDEQLPRLDKWIGIHEQEVEFCEVLDFVKEMTDAVTRRRIVRIGVPSLWQERLENDNAGHPGPA